MKENCGVFSKRITGLFLVLCLFFTMVPVNIFAVETESSQVQESEAVSEVSVVEATIEPTAEPTAEPTVLPKATITPKPTEAAKAPIVTPEASIEQSEVNPASDFQYKTINEGQEIEITGYIGSNTTVVIPSMIEGKPVTSMGDRAFYDCYNLTSIEIPVGVTRIGDRLFAGCRNLKSIVIPESVTQIGDWAFWMCMNLSSIVIPEGITIIEEALFIVVA